VGLGSQLRLFGWFDADPGGDALGIGPSVGEAFGAGGVGADNPGPLPATVTAHAGTLPRRDASPAEAQAALRSWSAPKRSRRVPPQWPPARRPCRRKSGEDGEVPRVQETRQVLAMRHAL
jgi:hypothetical protein